MAILLNELRWYGSAVMPDDDSATQIGGAIDKTKRVSFTDVSGLIQAVSASGGDVANVTVTFRDSEGLKLTQVVALTGQTPALYPTSVERLLKAVKAASITGEAAVEAQVATRTGTAQGGTKNTITLDAGAPAASATFVREVIRLTGGAASGQIRQILAYNGTTKVATVSGGWDDSPGGPGIPDSTTVFRISSGFYFEKTPTEALEVRRPHFDAAADISGGANRKFYEKIFVENTAPSGSLTSAQIIEQEDPSGLLAFGLATALNDAGDNGAGNNRQVAPAGITFNSLSKIVVGGSLGAASAQGTWLELTLNAGEAAQNTRYVPALTGTTV